MNNNEQQPNEPLQPDLHKASVSGSFVEAIKELSPNAWQMWVDKSGWYLPGKYALQVWIREDVAEVSAQGYGSCQPLLAKTPDELRECISIWWQNR